MGYVDLAGQDPNERELGFVVGPSNRWGLGIGRRAGMLAIEHASVELGVTRLWAETTPTNVRSRRLLVSLGFVDTPESPNESTTPGSVVFRRSVDRSETRSANADGATA